MRQLLLILGIIVFLGVLIYYARETLLKLYAKAVVFLREVRVEMQKVVWPSKQDVYGATFVVLVSVVVLTIAIGIEDRILTGILKLILSLVSS